MSHGTARTRQHRTYRSTARTQLRRSSTICHGQKMLAVHPTDSRWCISSAVFVGRRASESVCTSQPTRSSRTRRTWLGPVCVRASCRSRNCLSTMAAGIKHHGRNGGPHPSLTRLVRTNMGGAVPRKPVEETVL